MGRISRAVSWLAVTSLTATLMGQAPAAFASDDIPYPESDDSFIVRSPLGEQWRSDLCSAGEILHLNGPEVKEATRVALNGTAEELRDAVHTANYGGPLTEAQQRDSDASFAYRDSRWDTRESLETTASQYTNWDDILGSKPPELGAEFVDFMLRFTGPSVYGGQVEGPRASEESLEKVAQLRDASDDITYQWLADDVIRSGSADDVRLFFQYGGLPKAAEPGTAAFRISVEELKNRWSQCDSSSPLDYEHVLGEQIVTAHQEWQAEISAFKGLRDRVVGGEVQAFNALIAADKAMYAALDQAWLANYLLAWQRYWDGQDPGDSIHYPEDEVFTQAEADLRDARAEATRLAGVAQDQAETARAAADDVALAQDEATQLAADLEVPDGRAMLYALQSAQVTKAAAAGAEAAALATRTAQQATVATAETSMTLRAKAKTQMHAVNTEMRRAAAEEAAEQARRAAESAAALAADAAAQEQRAKSAQQTAEEAEQRAEQHAANARAKREAAQAAAEAAASEKATAERHRQTAAEELDQAEGHADEASAAWEVAHIAAQNADSMRRAAENAESEARTARDRAVQAKLDKDAAASHYQALEAAAAAAQGGENAEAARQAADEAKTAADQSSAAADAASQDAEAATEAAQQARAAATRAEALAERARANSEATWDSAWSAYGEAQTATAATAEAIDASEQAAADAEAAEKEAETAATAADEAQLEATAAQEEALAAKEASADTTGKAYAVALAAFAARDTAKKAAAAATEAIELGIPYQEIDSSAGLAVLSGQAALSHSEQQAAAAEARADEAAELARQAQELAEQADADSKAAAQAAADAAADARAAWDSVTAARSSAAGAETAARAAQKAEEAAHDHTADAWADAFLAEEAARQAEADARDAGAEASAAEQDAAAARQSADVAQADAGSAQEAAREADADADAAEEAAANADSLAAEAQEAARQAEEEERERLRQQREELAMTQPDPETGSTGFGGDPLSLSDEDLLRAECGQECVDEFKAAMLQANRDVIDWLKDNGADILLDFIGVTDIRLCLTKGNVSSCLWALLDVAALVAAPLKSFDAVKTAIKIASGVAKHWRAVERAKEILDKYRDLIKRLRNAPCGPNSFLPGTPVVMADGTTKAIEDVTVGDMVLATDPATGRTEAKQVTAEITGSGRKNLVEIEVTSDAGVTDTVTATDGHPFWVPALDEWVDATDLKSGQWLRTSAGTLVQITAVKRWTQSATVHNLTVAGFHTYYVAAAGTEVLTHNVNLCGSPKEVVEWIRAKGLPGGGSLKLSANLIAAKVDIEGIDLGMLISASGRKQHTGLVPNVGTQGNPQRYIPRALPKSPKNSRFHDSEIKLFNYIANKLGPSSTSWQGKIKLHSEREPCSSCSSVINQFRNDFPGIDVEVTYDRPYDQ